MTDLLCKKCDHPFQAEAFGHLEAMCPRCGWTVPAELLEEPAPPALQDELPQCGRCEMELDVDGLESAQIWDGKPYCRLCLEETGMSEFAGQRLEETVHFGLGSAFLRGLWSYLYLTTITTSLITAVFLFFIIAAFRGGMIPANDAFLMIFGVVLIWVFGFLFTSLVSLPMSLLPAVFSRRVQYRVANGDFIVETSFRTHTAKLNDCMWKLQSMGSDSHGAYFPKSPVIQVQFSDQRWVVCGFSDRMRRFWSAYFSLVDVPRLEKASSRHWIRPAMKYVAGGGTLGASLGYLFSVVTGDPLWISAWMFTGFFDGGIVLMSDMAVNQKYSHGTKGDFDPFVPIIFAGIAFYGGGFVGGWNVLIICGANAIIGLFVALYLRKRIKEIREEQTLENRTLDSPDSAA